MKDRITELLDKAVKTNDPMKLRQIAQDLRELGAWDAEQLVKNKAHEQERRMAEAVAR